MTSNTAARLLAQEGLRHIEDAVLMVLESPKAWGTLRLPIC